MVVKSINHVQSNGYRLNVENSKYLIFESEDYCKKLYHLEIIAFDLIDFCKFSEDNQEKQDEIYSHMLAMEIYLKSLPLTKTRSPQGLYNWAACDVTNPNFSPLLSVTFQVISGTSQIFRLLNPRDKKRYYATQYFNFIVTLLRYGLKILTDNWIEGDSLGYPDHPPRRCHSGRQPTFIHFFANTLKCLHGRLAG